MDGESSNGSEEVAEDQSSEEAPQEAASPIRKIHIKTMLQTTHGTTTKDIY